MLVGMHLAASLSVGSRVCGRWRTRASQARKTLLVAFPTPAGTLPR